jgi:hypothetical protein
MRGLDPRIHEAAQRLRPHGLYLLRLIMDCRVKPGNDAERAACNYIIANSEFLRSVTSMQPG